MDKQTVIETVLLADMGAVELLQLDPVAYHRECCDRGGEDSTGMRVCCATLSLVRLLSLLRCRLSGRRVLELGCGTGIVGLALLKVATPLSLVLTDGNPSAVALAQENITRNAPTTPGVSCCRLRWSSEEDIASVLKHHGGFDVVIGAELLYFNIVVSELVDAVIRIASQDGIFLHSHLCRKEGQLAEVVSLCRRRGWITVQLRQDSLFDGEELEAHPPWTSVSTLISGPAAAVKACLGEGLLFSELTEEVLAEAELRAREEESDPFRGLEL